MKELQFSIVVLMAMMCSALILLLPQRVRRDVVINRSRWFMTGALTLIGAQLLVHVNRAVEQWLATGGHLKAGITSPVAADAMGIPRYQLTAWVKASGHNSFTRWITSLRIEEAKQTLNQHHDWSIEAVADHCGFSRTHFQRVFKQEVGCSPADFQ